MKKGDKYVVIYIAGDDGIYGEGEWEVTTCTEETIIVQKISETEDEIYNIYEKGDKLKLGGKYGNPFTDWGDESFTVYPDQAGTPYIFTKKTASLR
jgi:hypothetical protein